MNLEDDYDFVGELKLNETREPHKVFCGSRLDQMRRLVADDRVPMNTAQLMQRRLDVSNSGDDKLKSTYMDNFIGTGDIIAYHPDGRVKIVLDSQALRDRTDIDTYERLSSFGEDEYNALEGEEFKAGTFQDAYRMMSRQDVKTHPIWRILSRDQKLLDDYTDYIFSGAKEKSGHDTAMGVHLALNSQVRGNWPIMNSWSLSGLKDTSSITGYENPKSNEGFFIGIASETLNPQRNNASGIETYTMTDLQALEKDRK